MAQHIIVTEYNPAWESMFKEEAAVIAEILGDNCVFVHHIGSTSVPGLSAKPIIDMMPVVKSLEKVDEKADAFAAAGYEYLGELGIPGRRYLRKGGDERTHQVHIFAENDLRNINRHLAVRDLLRISESDRAAYADLKKSLAEAFPYDIESYCDGKDDFVKNLEKKALQQFYGKDTCTSLKNG